MKQHLLLLSFVLFYLCAHTQNSETYYTVITKKDTATNSGVAGTMEPLHIISVNKEENSQVVRYIFDMRHQLFAAYQKKQLSSDSLQLFQRQYLLDTANLAKWEKENEMLIYIQLQKGKWKIIFDSNHSGVFTDDPVYYKDTLFFANRHTMAMPHNVNFWLHQSYTKELTFQISPNAQLPKKYSDLLFNSWGGTRKLRQGRLYIGVDSFLIKLYVVNKHLPYSLYSCNYSVSNVNENDFQLFSTAYPQYSRKDSLYIGNEILILDKVSIMGDTIVFRKVGENDAMKGVQPGAVLKSVFGVHLNSGMYEDISFKRRDTKYTLLHFWGSWCGPCIANLPKLKNFVVTNGEKLEIISFPFEQQQDTRKTKKLIQQYGLNWKQIIQLRDHPFQKPDVVKQLRIEHYPTYLLIDASGKILIRTSKLEELTEAVR